MKPLLSKPLPPFHEQYPKYSPRSQISFQIRAILIILLPQIQNNDEKSPLQEPICRSHPKNSQNYGFSNKKLQHVLAKRGVVGGCGCSGMFSPLLRKRTKKHRGLLLKEPRAIWRLGLVMLHWRTKWIGGSMSGAFLQRRTARRSWKDRLEEDQRGWVHTLLQIRVGRQRNPSMTRLFLLSSSVAYVDLFDEIYGCWYLDNELDIWGAQTPYSLTDSLKSMPVKNPKINFPLRRQFVDVEESPKDHLETMKPYAQPEATPTMVDKTLKGGDKIKEILDETSTMANEALKGSASKVFMKTGNSSTKKDKGKNKANLEIVRINKHVFYNSVIWWSSKIYDCSVIGISSMMILHPGLFVFLVVWHRDSSIPKLEVNEPIECLSEYLRNQELVMMYLQYIEWNCTKYLLHNNLVAIQFEFCATGVITNEKHGRLGRWLRAMKIITIVTSRHAFMSVDLRNITKLEFKIMKYLCLAYIVLVSCLIAYMRKVKRFNNFFKELYLSYYRDVHVDILLNCRMLPGWQLTLILSLNVLVLSKQMGKPNFEIVNNKVKSEYEQVGGLGINHNFVSGSANKNQETEIVLVSIINSKVSSGVVKKAPRWREWEQVSQFASFMKTPQMHQLRTCNKCALDMEDVILNSLHALIPIAACRIKVRKKNFTSLSGRVRKGTDVQTFRECGQSKSQNLVQVYGDLRITLGISSK